MEAPALEAEPRVKDGVLLSFVRKTYFSDVLAVVRETFAAPSARTGSVSADGVMACRQM